MRILHVVPSYLPAWRHGGPIWAVHGLCRGLVRRGHEVTVFTTDRDLPSEVPRGVPVARDGVIVHYFPLTWPRRLYRSRGLERELRKRVNTFEVVHLHSVFLRPVDAAAKAARSQGIPYVLAPRGMLVPDLFRRRGRLRKRLWLESVGRSLVSGAFALHVTSALEEREAAALGLDLPRVWSVPNGIDLPSSAPARDEAQRSPTIAAAGDDAPFFLFLGRISWKKGIERAIEAVARVPGTRLIIAGNDEEGLTGDLRAVAVRCGAADRVVFVGATTGRAKDDLLRGAIALVLTSHSENFGNVVLEAMAVGTPVLVTPEVGLASVVEECGCGLVVPGEPARVAEAMRVLSASPELRDEMGRRGVTEAQRRFSWDVVAEQMEHLYATIAPARQAASATAGCG